MASSTVGKRRRPLPMTAGEGAPVRAEDVDRLRELRAEKVRLQSRINRATDKIRAQLGPAEYGVDGQGVPIVWRVQTRTGGHYVRTNHRDDLKFEAPQ